MYVCVLLENRNKRECRRCEAAIRRCLALPATEQDLDEEHQYNECMKEEGFDMSKEFR